VQLEAIASDAYLRSPHFPPRERAAVLWAEHVAKNTAYERDDVFDEVRRHFNDAELVELTGVCGYFAINNRFQDSLHLPLEEAGEVDKIRQSVRGDPQRLKAFLETILRDWPAGPPPHDRTRVAPGAVSQAQARVAATAAGKSRDAALQCRVALDAGEADPTARGFLAAAAALQGAPSNAARVWAHVPHLGKMFLPYHWNIDRAGSGALPARLKTLALLRTSYANVSPYWIAHYRALASAAGVSADELEALGRRDDPAGWTAAERAVLDWTDAVAATTAKRDPRAFANLAAHFDAAEIAELTGVCATANMATLVYNALRVPVEASSAVAAMNRSAEVEPDRVRHYLEWVLAEWPAEFPAPDATLVR